MKPSGDPVRLGADPGTSPWLKSALNDAQADLPAIDLDGLSARVTAAIVADQPVGEVVPQVKSAVGKAFTGQAIVASAGLIIGITVGTVWTLSKSAHPVVPPPAAGMQSAPAVDLSARSSAAELPSAAPSAPVQAPVPQGRAVGTISRDGHGATGASEVALLDSARSLLPTDPRRALALTQEHAQRFPRSVLVQEREVIAIQALSCLGQTDAAKKRGLDFERHYPGSAHQNKVDQTIRGQ